MATWCSYTNAPVLKSRTSNLLASAPTTKSVPGNALRKLGWVIEKINGEYKGQDATHIFLSNQSYTHLLVYNKATLKKEAQLSWYTNVGFLQLPQGLVTPVVQGGLISILNGMHIPGRLDIVNISTGVVVKQQAVSTPLVLVGNELVSWGQPDFSVITFDVFLQSYLSVDFLFDFLFL